MDRKEYEMMFSVEDRHWWYVGMRRISTALIARYYPQRRDLVILDAGCGTGAVMTYLAPFGSVTGVDMSGLALDFCRRRGLCRLARSTVTSLPYASSSFDLVTSFDVLCHRSIGDYQVVLNEFCRVLKPGGRVFLRLPAYNWLHGHHDEAVHTAHRFTAREVRAALADAGLQPAKISYANTLLFPLALGKRLAEGLLPPQKGSDVHPNPAWQDRFLARFLYGEARWLVGHTLPWGLTVVGIGQKG